MPDTTVDTSTPGYVYYLTPDDVSAVADASVDAAEEALTDAARDVAQDVADEAATRALAAASEESEPQQEVTTVTGTVALDPAQFAALQDAMRSELAVAIFSLVALGLVYGLLIWQLSTRRGLL